MGGIHRPQLRRLRNRSAEVSRVERFCLRQHLQRGVRAFTFRMHLHAYSLPVCLDTALTTIALPPWPSTFPRSKCSFKLSESPYEVDTSPRRAAASLTLSERPSDRAASMGLAVARGMTDFACSCPAIVLCAGPAALDSASVPRKPKIDQTLLSGLECSLVS